LYGPRIGALVLSHTPQQISDLCSPRYNIPSFLSIPEKTELAKAPLLPPPASITQPVLSITYCSAASLPFATPSVVATGFGWSGAGLGTEGVTSRIARFLLTSLKENTALCAWTLFDFYEKPAGIGVVPLLIEYNFRGSAKDGQRATNPTSGPNCTSIQHSPRP
jgi:1-phosphatidylinositol phosphodiesterase